MRPRTRAAILSVRILNVLLKRVIRVADRVTVYFDANVRNTSLKVLETVKTRRTIRREMTGLMNSFFFSSPENCAHHCDNGGRHRFSLIKFAR